MDNSHEDTNFDIRLMSTPAVEEDVFFPCSLEVVISENSLGQKKGMIAVRETLTDSLSTFVEYIGSEVFKNTGVTYAYAFDFPVVFGPDCYHTGIDCLPSGMNTQSNKNYSERITKWRDRRYTGLSTTDGYLREVYPLNFVLETHLNHMFQGRPLSDYMKKVGKLERTSYNKQVFCWIVPLAMLDVV